MTLTQDDLQVFKAPFALEDHEFHLGRAYIKEDAITERIEEIDPDWDTTKPEITWVEQLGTFQISASLGLTIKGVTRYGVGSAVVSAQVRTNSQGKEYVTFDNEATKSAATDALKRAARLFGIGRYLLQAPKERDFARWLAGLSGGTPAPMQSKPNNARRILQPEVAQPQSDVIKTTVTSITKKTSTNGNAYMIVATEAGHNITVWSWSETFGLAGYTPDDFTDNGGVLVPNAPISINAIMGKRGYYDISQIAPKS